METTKNIRCRCAGCGRECGGETATVQVYERGGGTRPVSADVCPACLAKVKEAAGMATRGETQ